MTFPRALSAQRADYTEKKLLKQQLFKSQMQELQVSANTIKPNAQQQTNTSNITLSQNNTFTNQPYLHKKPIKQEKFDHVKYLFKKQAPPEKQHYLFTMNSSIYSKKQFDDTMEQLKQNNNKYQFQFPVSKNKGQQTIVGQFLNKIERKIGLQQSIDTEIDKLLHIYDNSEKIELATTSSKYFTRSKQYVKKQQQKEEKLRLQNMKKLKSTTIEQLFEDEAEHLNDRIQLKSKLASSTIKQAPKLSFQQKFDQEIYLLKTEEKKQQKEQQKLKKLDCMLQIVDNNSDSMIFD